MSYIRKPGPEDVEGGGKLSFFGKDRKDPFHQPIGMEVWVTQDDNGNDINWTLKDGRIFSEEKDIEAYAREFLGEEFSWGTGLYLGHAKGFKGLIKSFGLRGQPKDIAVSKDGRKCVYKQYIAGGGMKTYLIEGNTKPFDIMIDEGLARDAEKKKIGDSGNGEVLEFPVDKIS